MNVNIEAAIAILMISFFVLVIIRLPVTFALIISTALTMLYCKIPLMTMVQQMSKAVNSFSLLAIPFFILMGEIMGAGGHIVPASGVCQRLCGPPAGRSGPCEYSGLHVLRGDFRLRGG